MAAPFNFFKKYWPALVIGWIGLGLAIALPLLGVFAPFVGLGVLGIAAASGILLGITLVAVALVALTIWGIGKYRENKQLAAKPMSEITEEMQTPTPDVTMQQAESAKAEILKLATNSTTPQSVSLMLSQNPDILQISKIGNTENCTLLVTHPTSFSSPSFKTQDPPVNPLNEFPARLTNLAEAIDDKWGKNTAVPTTHKIEDEKQGTYYYKFGLQISVKRTQPPTTAATAAGPATATKITATTGGTAPTTTTTAARDATKKDATKVATFITKSLSLYTAEGKANTLGSLGITSIENNNAVTFKLYETSMNKIQAGQMENLIKQINKDYGLTLPTSNSTFTIYSSEVTHMAPQIPTDTIVIAPPTNTATTTAATTASPTTTTTTPPPKPPVVATQQDAERVKQTILDLCKADKEFGTSKQVIELLEIFPERLVVSKVLNTENYQVSLDQGFASKVFQIDADDPYFPAEVMNAYSPMLKQLVDAIDTKWDKGTATPTVERRFIRNSTEDYKNHYGFTISPEAIRDNILPKLGPAPQPAKAPATPTITTTTTPTIVGPVTQTTVIPPTTTTTTATPPTPITTVHPPLLQTTPPPATPAPVIASKDAQRVLDYIQGFTNSQNKQIRMWGNFLRIIKTEGNDYKITLGEPLKSQEFDLSEPDKNSTRYAPDATTALQKVGLGQIISFLNTTLGDKTVILTQSEQIKGSPGAVRYLFNIEISPQKIQEILPKIPTPTEGLKPQQ